MVQIGNIHIGIAETAKPPSLNIGEAYLLWDFLSYRYNCVNQTQYYYTLAHDADFKQVIKIGLNATLEKQVAKLEDELNKLKIPLPSRPEKYVNVENISGEFKDQFVFTQIFTGIEHCLNKTISATTSFVSNDDLREMFIGFTKEGLTTFNNLCKYGKIKGWMNPAPIYKNQP